MEATLLLANSAEGHANSGMVNALGLGWSVTGTPTPAAALVLLLKVPWDQTNVRHSALIDLLDADGQQAAIDGAGKHVQIQAEFEVGRPAGLVHGIPIDQAVVINLPPGMRLTSGASYQWRVQINGEVVATRSFQVRR